MTQTYDDLLQAVDVGDEAAVQQWLSRNGVRPLPDAQAIILPARSGHEAIVRLLLPVSDLKAGGSLALAVAARNGHEAIVRLLLPVSDPKASDSSALAWAAESGHEAIVEILIESSSAAEAWRALIQHEAWEGLDHLASYMPEEMVEAVLKKAPAEAMPRALAHRLNQTLAKTLASAGGRSLKNRL